MPADVVLEEDGRPDWIGLHGAVVKVAASDILLDASARRRAGAGGLRRALVHDQGDGLTVNFNHDYPGGVTLNGVATLVPKKRDGAPNPHERRTQAELVIAGGVQFDWEHAGGIAAQRRIEKVSLQSLIADLRAQIDALAARVAALEAQ